MDLLLPANITRIAPSWFITQLKDTDPNLIVYFNEHKGRWIIDRCTRDGERSSILHEHSPTCPKTNVMIVEDDGKYMPLCDQVIDDIRSKDAWNSVSYEEFHRQNENKSEAAKAKTEQAIKALYREASIDNKHQLAKAWTLVSRHDTARVH